MEIVLSRKNMNKCENLALQNGISLEKTIRDSAQGVFDSYAFPPHLKHFLFSFPFFIQSLQ